MPRDSCSRASPNETMRHDHILSTTQLSRADIEAVLDRAAEFARDPPGARYPDRVLALCFFEPSTRTKMSFATAMKRLGGDTVDMGTVESSSVKKGESLADTVRVVEGYADALVLRHPSEGSATMARGHAPAGRHAKSRGTAGSRR